MLTTGEKTCGVSHVVRCGQEIWLVAVRVVIDVIDTLGLVGFQLEVWRGRAQIPDLDSPVQTRRGECVGVFRVDGQRHDII